MYERFYGFAERPFSLLPDPDFLFLSESHRTALDLVELAVVNHSGFCVISGEIGVGKTTLIRELLNRLDENIQVGLVTNTHPSFGELLQWIMAAYGLPCGGQNKLELHKRFIDFTIQQYAENRHTLLIIDEAQNLTPAALEELRMLSNVNSGKDFVLQIILVGQQQLREKLKDPQLEQFAQRIAQDCHINSLNEEETGDYIRHRLQHAGGKPTLFSDYAMQAVYAHTDGIPRLINRLCDLCLVYGYSEQSPMIDAELVDRVAADQKMGALSYEHHAAAASARPFVAASLNVADQTTQKELKTGADKPSPGTQGVDLRKLVVEAERQQSSGSGKRGALWLLVVMLVVGAAGWVTRDLWLQQFRLTLRQVAIKAEAIVPAAWSRRLVPVNVAEPAKEKPVVPPELQSKSAGDVRDRVNGDGGDAELLTTKNGP